MVSVSKLKEPKTAKEVDLQKVCWKMLEAWHISEGLVLSDYSYHVPNGANLAGDRRGRARQMASLKVQGFKNGVSDIVIAYPVWADDDYNDHIVWAGAYLELKMPGRKPTVEQLLWLDRMSRVYYYTAVIQTEPEFKDHVTAFLAGKYPPPNASC